MRAVDRRERTIHRILGHRQRPKMTMVYRVMTTAVSFNKLSDLDLISEVKRLAHAERHATAALIASLAEMDARRLYLGEGCASLFVYCTRVLHLSEHAAYGRIEAARAARRFPTVLERLERGELTLTSLCLLQPHLTEANCSELFDAARHASKRDVERLIATIAPRPDAPAVIRKVPAHPSATATERLVKGTAPLASSDSTDNLVAAAATVPPSSPVAPLAARTVAPVASPLSAERYKLQFTVSRETPDKLRRAQDLLRHSIPDGDPAAVFDRALTLLLEHLERTNWRRRKRRDRCPARSPQAAVIFRRPSAALSGRATAAAVRSKGLRAAAVRQASWSFIMSSRLRGVGSPRSATSSFGAALTISTKRWRSSATARCSRARCRRRIWSTRSEPSGGAVECAVSPAERCSGPNLAARQAFQRRW
jgi:hypothetical protein